MTELPATQSRQKKLVVFGALTVAVSYGMARFALGLTTPRIVEDQIVTEAHIGYASSLSFFTYVIACFISGVLLKRGKWKISIFAVLVTAGVGSLLVAISTSALIFMAGIGVVGAAAGFTSGAIAYRLTREVSPRWESRAQAIANAGTGVGVALATGLLLATSSWRFVYATASVLAVIFCLFFVFQKTKTGQVTPVAADNSDVTGSWRYLVVPIILTLLMGAGSSAYWTFGRSLAESTVGLSEFQSLLFWGAIGVAGIAGSFSGDAATKLGTKLSWTLGSVILGLSILCLPVSGNVLIAIVSGALFGAFYTIMCGLTIELGREAWPQAVGSSTSILFATIAVGQTAGSMLNGLAIAHLNMGTLFVVGGILTLAGGILVWCKKTRTA